MTLANSAHAQPEEPAFALLEIEVVDTAGKPLAEVAIDVEMDNLEFPIQVDKDGFGSLNLSAGISLDLKFALEGYVPQHVHWSRGSKIPDELKVELQAGLPLGGVVRDERGQPIEGVEIFAKTLTKGFRGGQLQPNIDGVIAETDMQGRWEANVSTKELLHLRLEISRNSHIGLTIPRVSKDAYQQMQKLKYEVVLQTRIPSSGTIVDNQGQPVVGAKVYVAHADKRIQLANGRVVNFIDGDTFESVVIEPTEMTDTEGKFTLPIQKPGFTVVCIDDYGWAEVRGSKWDENHPIEVKLTPWAQLSGHVELGGKAAVDDEVSMVYLADFQQNGRDRSQRNRNLEWRYFTRTNTEGDFSFDRVVPGVANVMRRINTGDDSYEKHLASHGIEVSVVADKQVNVKLGGSGRAVVGKCILQDNEKPASRIYGEVILMKNDVVGSTLKKAFFYWGAGLSISGAPRTQRQAVFLGEPTQLGTYAMGLAADGSFRIEDVPPGKYKMETVFFGPPQERKPGKKIGVIMGNHMILAAKKGEEGPFDLGESTATSSKPVAAPQETPAEEVK